MPPPVLGTTLACAGTSLSTSVCSSDSGPIPHAYGRRHIVALT